MIRKYGCVEYYNTYLVPGKYYMDSVTGGTVWWYVR